MYMTAGPGVSQGACGKSDKLTRDISALSMEEQGKQAPMTVTIGHPAYTKDFGEMLISSSSKVNNIPSDVQTIGHPAFENVDVAPVQPKQDTSSKKSVPAILGHPAYESDDSDEMFSIPDGEFV